MFKIVFSEKFHINGDECERRMESGPGALPEYKCYKAAVNSLCEKISEIFTGSAVVTLQRSDTF